VGDASSVAVVNGALAIPRLEDGFNRQLELLPGVLGEVLAGLAADQRLELGDRFLPARRGDLRVGLDTLLLLDLGDDLFEKMAINIQDHLAEHLDQAAVSVPGEALAGLGRQRLHGLVIQAQIEDGVHHAGHGELGAGAHRHQQGVVGITELAPHLLAQRFHALQHLLPQPFGQGVVVVQVFQAGLRRAGEAGRHRQAQPGHLSQAATLAPEEVPHLGAALFKEIDPLLCHGESFPCCWR